MEELQSGETVQQCTPQHAPTQRPRIRSNPNSQSIFCGLSVDSFLVQTAYKLLLNATNIRKLV